jgi:imidazolonepropionase-like amidohydrolase
MAGSTSAHQNQLAATPVLATRPAIARGVSAAKVVATIDVPAIHQGRLRPAAKNSTLLVPARRACHAPHASAPAR